MEIQQITVNPFGVNCYVLSNSKKEAILIDPSVSNARERDALKSYIDGNNLKVCHVVNTHLHLDHVLGNAFAERVFGVKAKAHEDDAFLLDLQEEQSDMFGLPVEEPAGPLGGYLAEGDTVEITGVQLQVLHIPGHSPGGIALYCDHPEEASAPGSAKKMPPVLFSGDILFNGGRGRTDLFGGNEEDLVSGIQKKLFSLPEKTVVFPGHGPSTTIGNEKMWF